MPIYSEALRIYRDVYGSEHPSIAEILLVVAGFQNTFMNDMQQYIEHINTRWAYDVKTFRYVILTPCFELSLIHLLNFLLLYSLSVADSVKRSG